MIVISEETKEAPTLRRAVRATEVSIGAGDTDAYEHDVEDLVIELESLRQAVEETRTA